VTAPTASASTASAPSAATVEAWEHLLSVYSAALDEHRSVLLLIETDVTAGSDVSPAPSFVPPVNMPPMPHELRPWAQTLMGTTDALVQLAAELTARSEAQLLARPTSSPTANEATLDALL
jgi:hypothetical protein